MEESVTYQAIIDKGVLKGAVQHAHKMLLLQGAERFGAPSAEVRAAIEGIRELDKLDQLSIRLLKTNSWQELLESSL